jgi:hypothetical protein
MKHLLKIIHLSLVFLTPVIFAYLKIISKETDPLLSLTNKLFIILSASWSSYLIFELIRRGSNTDVKTNLLKKYRQLLNSNTVFLWLSDTLLFVCFLLLSYQIIFFRAVEFIASKKVELYESSSTGELSKIGDLEANNIENYRVRVGTKYFLYKPPLSEQFNSIDPVTIPFIWNKVKLERIKLTEYDEFELLH